MRKDIVSNFLAKAASEFESAQRESLNFKMLKIVTTGYGLIKSTTSMEVVEVVLTAN